MRCITNRLFEVARLLCAALVLGIVAGVSPVSFGAEDQEPIQIGAPIPLTGPFASDGEVMRQGILLAINELNEEGGLLGRQLEMTTYDIGDLTPDKLQSAATNLVDSQDVDVLINGYGAMGPDIPAFCPHEQPYIHNAATPNVTDMMIRMACTNIFMATDVGRSFGRIAFRQILSMDHEFPNKRVALLHGPFDWETDKIAGIREAAEERGWEIVSTEEVSYGTSEWSGIISRIREADPSLVFLELLDPDAVWRFISQFTDDPAENAMVYMGYTVSVPAFGEFSASGEANGVLGMTLSSHDPQSELGRDFMKRWHEAYDENPPYSIAAQIYDHVMIWANAVEKVGDVRDFDAINRTIAETTYEGLTGVFDFNNERYVNAGADTVPSFLLQVQESEVRPVMRGDHKLRDLATPVWFDN